MDMVIFELSFTDGSVTYMAVQHSDNKAATPGCDACLSYELVEPGSTEPFDGGEMDYDSTAKDYADLRNAAEDLADFVADLFPCGITGIKDTGLDRETFFGD